MNCAEADAFGQAYVDGELAGVDREAVERHLVTCAACASRMRLEARFKAAVRAHLPRPEVPFALRQRIEAAITAQPIAPRRWPTLPGWFSFPRMLPAGAAVLLLVAITGTVRRSHSAVLEQAERSYRTEMPMDITDCGSIASWFRGRVDFPVRAPSVGGATCQGGRLVNVSNRPAAYIVYRASDGHRVAFLVFDPRDETFDAPERRVVNGREITYGTGPGISTAAYRDRGLGYVATSDVDEDTLVRMVQTSFGR